MEIARILPLKDLGITAKAVARVGITLATIASLRFASPAFADGIGFSTQDPSLTDGKGITRDMVPPSRMLPHNATAVPVDSKGNMVLQPIYRNHVVEPGDSIWEMTSQRVRREVEKGGYTLPPQMQLEAINGIRILTEAQNGRSLDNLRVGYGIKYPIDGVVGIIVQSLSTNPAGLANEGTLSQILRQDLIIIANPSPDSPLDPNFNLMIGQVNRLLQDMITLNPVLSSTGIKAEMKCGVNGEVEELDIRSEESFPSEGEDLWDALVDEATQREYIFFVGGFGGHYSRSLSLVAYARSFPVKLRNGVLQSIRNGQTLTLNGQGQYTVVSFFAPHLPDQVPPFTSRTILHTSPVKTCS